jgi:hypothetical protein
MGAHHLADAEPARLTRVAGRGALVASTALALTGSGAGLALAHTDPGDGHGGGSGHGSGHGSGNGSGHGSEHRVASSAAATCDPELASRLADGLLGDLGLTSSPEQLCAASPDGQSSPPQGSSGQTSSGQDSSTQGSSDQGTSSSTAPTGSDSTPAPAPAARTAAAPATPTNPVDIPPAPGETKVIDLPDRPSGHSGRRT